MTSSLKWALTRNVLSWPFPKEEAVSDYFQFLSRTKRHIYLFTLGFPSILSLTAAYNAVQGALEWLEVKQDKSLEEINAASQPNDDEPPALQPGEEAQSLVCNECGKKFRSQAQAEFHASKTEHVDFSESTEEIAPLTEEEKTAKLEALREKLAAKRANQVDEDKAERKRNEVSCTSYTSSVVDFTDNLFLSLCKYRKSVGKTQRNRKTRKKTSRRKSA